ncbi:tRNA (guanosine(46)-N7)-methyltransferase TrmB [Agitococcus lubricus]|uniref:tRNA (guanine-N(7)-)-methyltransferase n=1 Tax=Agitococcus lubricus TaxID=1077255 RepID=A0A2T5IZG0_9GAMM|nr:tRNA (guanosine(46)-N7)-methyltransferase TrmB [Agitococcus lubricus]PTQ89399.1 tRNA (guanine-N(7)-)-methyltransferase [Agitococcus lubricus]
MTDSIDSAIVKKEYPRRIMTFMRRSSAYTASQQKGIDDYGTYYLLETEARQFDQQQVFGRHAPLTVEIGFGMGFSLVEMALAAPERDFIGIEIHPNGLAQICYEAGERQLKNLRIIDGDALLMLEHYFTDASIDTVQLYFADPWPKKKHHKRRFVQLHHMQLIRQKLKLGGVFHAATDWEHYALWMLDILEASEGYTNMMGKGQFSPRPDYRPLTKFEMRGQNLGHGVWDVLFHKTA